MLIFLEHDIFEGMSLYMANGRNEKSLSQDIIRLYQWNFRPGANLTASIQEADMFLETQRAFTFRSEGFHSNVIHRPHKALERHISWEITFKFYKFSETAEISVINNSFAEITIILFCKLYCHKTL